MPSVSADDYDEGKAFLMTVQSILAIALWIFAFALFCAVAGIVKENEIRLEEKR